MSDFISREAVLDLFQDNAGTLYNYARVWEAVEDMPSVTPTQNCVENALGALDCISRQAVLDGIDTYIYKAQSTGTQDDFYSFAELVVKALPSVRPQKTQMIDKSNFDQEQYKADLQCAYDCGKASVNPQEPKTGHWIEKDGFDGDVYYDCSECGESWTTIEGTPWDNEWNYCPNCGAKMVEPQESEDKE